MLDEESSELDAAAPELLSGAKPDDQDDVDDDDAPASTEDEVMATGP